MQVLSANAVKTVSGGSFELEYDTGGRPGDGSQNPFDGFTFGFSFGIGPISIGFEVGSCPAP